MDKIITELCLRRLNKSANTNINDLRSGHLKPIINELGNCHHIACIFETNNIYNKLCIGINSHITGKNVGTIHAEIKAINNLPPCPNNKKKKKKIDIFIIRTSNTGKIGMSKPCINCIIEMSSLHKKRGYQIKNVAYTDINGEIINSTLIKLLSGDFHISRYYKTHNYQHKLLNI